MGNRNTEKSTRVVKVSEDVNTLPPSINAYVINVNALAITGVITVMASVWCQKETIVSTTLIKILQILP